MDIFSNGNIVPSYLSEIHNEISQTKSHDVQGLSHNSLLRGRAAGGL